MCGKIKELAVTCGWRKYIDKGNKGYLSNRQDEEHINFK